MNQTLAEILLLVTVAMNAALLSFVAGVLKKVMNDMSGTEFQRFLASFYIHSTRSPFMVTVLTVPLVGAVPYFYLYGFGNRWIIAGLGLWLVAGSVGKIIKLPIFKTVPSLDSSDDAGLGRARQKLNAGNMLQAALNIVATALMLVPFVPH